ncbi:MAG: phosphate acyltransferase [Succinivibrio sp.]
MQNQKTVTVALDGTGGDNVDPKSVASAVRFALILNPDLRVEVFGNQKLKQALVQEKVDAKRYSFTHAPECVPQDEDPRKVLEGYYGSAMRKAIEAVRDGVADVAVSSGGTGPLVSMSRHILGCMDHIRPALCARLPSGPEKFCLMIDLGANAQCKSQDLLSFAKLGHAAYKLLYSESHPRISILNVGTEPNKGSTFVKEGRDLISKCRELNCCGFIEADRIFCDDADVIVTDGFTGNVALKAAEGVARAFLDAPGIKKFFSKLARPDWLIPWQYNGSMLLGVNGLVIKSHASAGKEAIAVALAGASKLASLNLTENMHEELKKII